MNMAMKIVIKITHTMGRSSYGKMLTFGLRNSGYKFFQMNDMLYNNSFV